MRCIPLDGIPADQRRLLRDIFDAALDAATEAVERSAGDPGPDGALVRAAIYRRLLGAVDMGEIEVPDEQARVVVEEIVIAIDAENQYPLVVAEHDALHNLLGLLSNPRGS